MGSPNRLKSCCGCYSLKSGTIIAGALGILLSIASIVVILTTKIDFKTIVREFFKYEFMMIFMASLSLFLFVDFRWYYSKRYSQNHSHSQSVHDNNSVIAFDSWCDNREWKCEEISTKILNFISYDKQKNHYLFLPWIILGIMLCIGLLVDVIYTSVVFFIDGFTTSGFLWLAFGLLAVGKFWILLRIKMIKN